MKKILLILVAIFSVNLPSLAYITPEQALSEEYIQNHGYSDETSRLIDLQNAQINGAKSIYKSKDPAYYADKKVNFIRKVFMYIDPGLDDGKFMQNNIEYSTKWNDL